MDLFTQLLDPAYYRYNPYALPQLICAFVTFAFGVTIYLRENGSREGVLYLYQTSAIGTWFLGFGVAYLAIDVDTADRWIRLGNAGVALIPALTLQFTLSVVRPGGWQWFLRAVWVGSIIFAAASLFAPGYFAAPYRYDWGYYTNYTAYATSFVVFVIVTITVATALYWWAHKGAHPQSVAGRRARLLFIAFAVGSIGAIDFLPAYGINIYPFGYLPVVWSIGLVSYVTGRYRLVDITPAFAAKQIIETMNDGLFVLDNEGVVRVANETLLRLVGMCEEDVLGKRVPAQFRQMLTRSDIVSLSNGIPIHNREIEYVQGDRTKLIFSVSISIMPERHNQAAAYVGVVRDITQQKRTEERIRLLAYYDNLTGLPNRQLFQDRLRAALSEAARRKRMVALLFLDLDNFKRINDTLGHALGDELLQAVAARLLRCVRKVRGGKESEDTVARLGGDEFIVALHDIDSQEDAVRVAERILASVATPVRLSQHEIAVTGSIGISMYPNDGEDAGSLLKSADVAMYQAKEAGRNNYLFYDRSINAAIYDRLSIETKLRRALDQGRLSLHYQPLVAMHERRAVGVEALLRWHDAEIGWIPPARFIPIAEESGLILPIGEWVLRKACAQASLWANTGRTPLRVAVNLSGRQIRDRDFLAMVHAALESANLEPRLLELELTESIVMQDALQTIRTFEALKAMGVQLSIDDFGTGYSSLSYLRSFPINTLKIDRSFVHDINAKLDSGPIVAAIIAMARSLNLGVIGEGVETEEQQAFLQLHGCKYAQGFLFSRPLPISELEEWTVETSAHFARR